MFNISSDIAVSKEVILQKISQEQIFSLIFGELPELEEKVCSPFREDSTPGCYFSFKGSTLYFVDFAFNKTYKGIDCRYLDCFAAIMVAYNLDYVQALEYITECINNKNITYKKPTINPLKSVIRKRSSQNMIFKPRNWQIRDKKFWTPYGISKEDLISDFVFPVEKLSFPTYSKHINELCYAYTDFKGGRKQLYFPYGKQRFLMSCTKDDIFGLSSLDTKSHRLFITKSYKDYRVLKNCGFNTIAFLNEGNIPTRDVLDKVLNNKSRVSIFFDNDTPGIEAGKNVRKTLSSMYPGIKFRTIILNTKEKDPSDYVKKFGQEKLIKYINDYSKRSIKCDV